MNISAVNTLQLQQPQQAFKGKGVTVIKEVRPLSQYAEMELKPQIERVVETAGRYGKEIRIAQLEDDKKLLVNVGLVTKILDGNTTKLDEVPRVIRTMIKASALTDEQGLQKGLSYMA